MPSIEDDMGVVIGPKPTPKAAPVAVEAMPDAPAAPADAKRIKIVLEEHPDIPPNGLYIGHNGVGYLLRAGEPVLVPEFLLNVLDDAVQAVPQIDPQSLQVLGYRNKTRFPYRVMRD